MTTLSDHGPCLSRSIAALALGLLCLGGCAHRLTSPPLPDSAGPGDQVSSPAYATTNTPVVAEAPPARPPEGAATASLRNVLEERPDLAQLDLIYRQALELLSRVHYEAAEDLLFVLKEEAVAMVPTDRDSVSRRFLASLDRRVTLLAGVLAEDRLLSLSVAEDDSLLAVAYDNLRGLSFPDSLIPVAGAQRGGIQSDLLGVDNDAVRQWMDYFTGDGRASLQKWLDRKAAVDSLIYRHLDEAGLPRELIYLAAIESGFNTHARSGVGAVGPWQFMPGTARHYHLRCDWWVDERRDAELATRAAVTYLSQLYHHFQDWALVLAAYNTGEHRVDQAIRLAGHDHFWDLHLPWQTRNHVPKFVAVARICEDPLAFGFDPSLVSKLGYDVIDVTDATDLSLIAECAGVAKEDVVALNPALLRQATPPGAGEYPVRVPPGTGTRCMKKLRAIPMAERLTWRRHTVQRGETLSAVAERYGTSVTDIAELNGIRQVALIHPGDKLLIPVPAVLADRAEQRVAASGHYVPPSGYERVSYRVQGGDTLSGIARKLGVSLRHLRRVNNLHDTSLIKPGQKVYAYRPPQP
ncbi:LysM peptidoglycan-binding domain-containing protein [bacterium]|nr:LysM peptidoglycan-binding domain-containing protein [bacterium]